MKKFKVTVDDDVAYVEAENVDQAMTKVQDHFSGPMVPKIPRDIMAAWEVQEFPLDQYVITT